MPLSRLQRDRSPGPLPLGGRPVLGCSKGRVMLTNHVHLMSEKTPGDRSEPGIREVEDSNPAPEHPAEFVNRSRIAAAEFLLGHVEAVRPVRDSVMVAQILDKGVAHGVLEAYVKLELGQLVRTAGALLGIEAEHWDTAATRLFRGK